MNNLICSNDKPIEIFTRSPIFNILDVTDKIEILTEFFKLYTKEA